MEEPVEIAPGIVYKEEAGQHRVVILDPSNPKIELIAWDFEEISKKPDSWLSSLKAVSLATQHGPGVAKLWVEKKRQERNAPYGTLVCNVCNKKFAVQINHPYAFIMKLKDKNYHD